MWVVVGCNAQSAPGRARLSEHRAQSAERRTRGVYLVAEGVGAHVDGLARNNVELGFGCGVRFRCRARVGCGARFRDTSTSRVEVGLRVGEEDEDKGEGEGEGEDESY